MGIRTKDGGGTKKREDDQNQSCLKRYRRTVICFFGAVLVIRRDAEQLPQRRARFRLAPDILCPQHTTLDLIRFDRLKERLEITFPETLISLAFYKFEENGANHGLRKNLQQ
jgi:hypothetical protein